MTILNAPIEAPGSRQLMRFQSGQDPIFLALNPSSLSALFLHFHSADTPTLKPSCGSPLPRLILRSLIASVTIGL